MTSSPALDIQLAAMSLGWGNPTGADFVPWLREVKRAGYIGVTGFAGNDDFGWTWDMVNNPKRFADQLKSEGLALASVDISLHMIALDEAQRVCDFMQALDCDILVGTNKWRDRDYGEFADWLNQIGTIARQRGIRLYFHNNTAGMGETRAEVEQVLSLVDRSLVHAMVDLGHATKDFAAQPVAERAIRFLRDHWDEIDFIEFKDWHSETDLNTPVGEGMCDYPAVFDLLKSRGYSGWIVVEQNDTSRGRSATECAAISREAIRQGLGI